MSFTIKKGFNFAEILIATSALSILMMGFAQFTADVFNVSARHAGQLTDVNQARFATERIMTEISKAAYIYPSGTAISLADGLSISTSDSIAMLLAENDGKYRFVAYYLDNANGESDLYEYISANTYTWTENSSPANDIISFTGSSSVIANDIDETNTDLEYILNYQNAPSDKVLKGQISNISDADRYALIKGVNFKIYQAQSDDIIEIKGISRNVPRFFE